MSRGKTPKYDYPKKEEWSLSNLSQKHLGKKYIDTTDFESKKIKKIFRKLHGGF